MRQVNHVVEFYDTKYKNVTAAVKKVDTSILIEKFNGKE
jgi:hypothetical protein